MVKEVVCLTKTIGRFIIFCSMCLTWRRYAFSFGTIATVMRTVQSTQCSTLPSYNLSVCIFPAYSMASSKFIFFRLFGRILFLNLYTWLWLLHLFTLISMLFLVLFSMFAYTLVHFEFSIANPSLSR